MSHAPWNHIKVNDIIAIGTPKTHGGYDWSFAVARRVDKNLLEVTPCVSGTLQLNPGAAKRRFHVEKGRRVFGKTSPDTYLFTVAEKFNPDVSYTPSYVPKFS
jgi:hypothetical protein